MSVPRLSAEELTLARAAGAATAEVLQMLAQHVRPGVTTDELDRLCHDYIVGHLKAVPANIGFYGYPKTVCASVNHVACHGLPSGKRLRDGDIVNIDVAVCRDGWYGDTSRMYFVGTPGVLARRLVDTAYEALCAGIRAVRPGARLGDVGHAIERVARREGFSVARNYCGHGIGRVYHGEPSVLHYGPPGVGMMLEPGMVFTIEPILNAGAAATRELGDGWTVVTRDHSLSAQWEHMVAVTEDGFEVLSRWPEGEAAWPD